MANDPRFEVYPRNPLHEEDVIAPGFGWRFRDSNGRITFIGGEGFTRREDAHRALRGACADAIAAIFTITAETVLAILDSQDHPGPRNVVDLNEAGDVIDPATGAPILP